MYTGALMIFPGVRPPIRMILMSKHQLMCWSSTKTNTYSIHTRDLHIALTNRISETKALRIEGILLLTQHDLYFNSHTKFPFFELIYRTCVYSCSDMAVFTFQLLRSRASHLSSFFRLIWSQSQQIVKIANFILIRRLHIKVIACHSFAVMQMSLWQRRGTQLGPAIGHQTEVLS